MILILLFLPIYGGAQVLNLPILTMYRFGIYFTAFLIGYYIFSHDSVQDRIESMHIPMTCLALISGILYTLCYQGRDYTSPECLKSFLTNAYLWFTVLAVLECFKKYVHRETALARYMRNAGFGLYVLHYPVLMVCCYVLHSYFALPAIWNYWIALAAEMVFTLGAYETVKRIPVVGYLVLRIKGSKRADAKMDHHL